MPIPTELTLVLLRFRFFRLAPIHTIISTESSPMVPELRSKCSSIFISAKTPNRLREDLDTSNKDKELVLIHKKASASFMKVAPAQTSFSKGALSPLPSRMESMVQLLIFKHSRADRFGKHVTLVQARLRKLSLGNL